MSEHCTLPARYELFFETLAEFRKASIGFLMFVCLSVLMEQLGFHWNLIFDYFFENLSRKFKFY